MISKPLPWTLNYRREGSSKVLQVSTVAGLDSIHAEVRRLLDHLDSDRAKAPATLVAIRNDDHPRWSFDADEVRHMNAAHAARRILRLEPRDPHAGAEIQAVRSILRVHGDAWLPRPPKVEPLACADLGTVALAALLGREVCDPADGSGPRYALTFEGGYLSLYGPSYLNEGTVPCRIAFEAIDGPALDDLDALQIGRVTAHSVIPCANWRAALVEAVRVALVALAASVAPVEA